MSCVLSLPCIHVSLRRASFTAGAFVCSALLGSGCKPKDSQFESVCQIVHRDVVEVDGSGKPALVDYELEWDPCPGDQFQVVRGSKDFAACMNKYDIGDYVPVRVVHHWDSRGYFTWDLFQVGDCHRPIEADNEGSYEKSQECHDQMAYGQKSGFVCSRRPFAGLVKVCPWMARN